MLDYLLEEKQIETFQNFDETNEQENPEDRDTFFEGSEEAGYRLNDNVSHNLPSSGGSTLMIPPVGSYSASVIGEDV